ncbi:MAG TPA: hypothetical protein VHO94_05815, partial [Oscillospiraceae bacterium]|nr:hypothetical protein [Oscillospiraceae bacterium]
ETGLEPVRQKHTPLKRACLPIPALALNSTSDIISLIVMRCQPQNQHILRLLGIFIEYLWK